MGFLLWQGDRPPGDLIFRSERYQYNLAFWNGQDREPPFPFPHLPRQYRYIDVPTRAREIETADRFEAAPGYRHGVERRIGFFKLGPERNDAAIDRKREEYHQGDRKGRAQHPDPKEDKDDGECCDEKHKSKQPDDKGDRESA